MFGSTKVASATEPAEPATATQQAKTGSHVASAAESWLDSAKVKKDEEQEAPVVVKVASAAASSADGAASTRSADPPTLPTALAVESAGSSASAANVDNSALEEARVANAARRLRQSLRAPIEALVGLPVWKLEACDEVIHAVLQYWLKHGLTHWKKAAKAAKAASAADDLSADEEADLAAEEAIPKAILAAVEGASAPKEVPKNKCGPEAKAKGKAAGAKGKATPASEAASAAGLKRPRPPTEHAVMVGELLGHGLNAPASARSSVVCFGGARGAVSRPQCSNPEQLRFGMGDGQAAKGKASYGPQTHKGPWPCREGRPR